MHKKEEDQSAKVIRCIGGVVLGGALALLVCMLLLLVFSVGISAGVISNKNMVQFLFAGCVVGSFFGGIIAIRRCGSRALLTGLATGAVMFLLLLTVGCLCYPEMSLENRGAGLGLSCLIGGMAAGLLKGKPKKKRRK